MPQQPAKGRITPAAMMVRGALYSYLRPRLAMDAQPRCMAMVSRAVDGVTSRNYNAKRPQIANALRRSTQGRLAQDNGISDLAALLSALAPEAQQADQAPGLGQIASNPSGSAGPMTSAAPPMASEGESEDILAKVKAYLEEEGVAPEILNNLDAFLAEHQPTNGGPNGPTNGPGPMANVAQPNVMQPDPANGGGGDRGAAAPPPMMGGMDNLENLGEHAIPRGGSAEDRVIPSRQAAQDQTEELTTTNPESEKLGYMEPRGGLESEFTPESAGDEAMDDNDDPWTHPDRDDEADDEEAEDQEVPEEQSEQMGGVPKVSSEGTPSRVKNGGGQDRAITKKAMDQAIKLAQDAAIKNQRQIWKAAQYASQWIGQNNLAMDAASPSEVYRLTLKALGHPRADKLNTGALKDVLDAQPRPGMRMAQDRQMRAIAQDSNTGAKPPSESFLERFPMASKIIIQ